MRRLDWGPAGSAGDLLVEWDATVRSLLAFRKALGPPTPADPFVLLAIATKGAMRAGAGSEPEPGPRMNRFRDELSAVTERVADWSAGERAHHMATGLHLGYELVHQVRIHTADDQAREWLMAGETAADGAIHALVRRTPTGDALAAWQDALADAQRVSGEPILKRGVALGHAAIISTTRAVVEEATQAGALPASYSALLASLTDLEDAHRATHASLAAASKAPSRTTQALMLKLGTAVQQLTKHPGLMEDPIASLDALLRSGIGQAVVVAGLTGDPAARIAAGRLQSLSLGYLANPQLLQRSSVDVSPNPDPHHLPATGVAASSWARELDGWQPLRATIASGAVLDAESIIGLCRARDVGRAAASAAPANPPPILAGTDPAEWPQLAVVGQQAIIDMVTSVTPMVYAITRNVARSAVDDVRGELFVGLMRAAHAFEPNGPHSTTWSRYAWQVLQHDRWRQVDPLGVPQPRTKGQIPRMLGLDGTEPISRQRGPEEVVENQARVEAIKAAVNALPDNLRASLLGSIAGRTTQDIGDEMGISNATVARNIIRAREILRQHPDLARSAENTDTRPPSPVKGPGDPSPQAPQPWRPDNPPAQPWTPPPMSYDSPPPSLLQRAQVTSHEPVFRSVSTSGRGLLR